jgi:Tfp pilus assembly protein PilN
MIEINLLPEELRRTEGTPPARLAAILLSVIIACCIGALIVSYYFVKIPGKKQDIATAKSEIQSLEKRKADVENTRQQINNLEAKVKQLDNLTHSRLRYARLLHRLCNAVTQTDGAWLRTFNIDDAGQSAPNAGRRYNVTITGYACGNTPLEMDSKLIEFVGKLRQEFEIAPDKDFPPGEPPKDDVGWCKFINARFYPPVLIAKAKTGLNAPSDIDARVLKQMHVPTTALDFQMTMVFELPPMQ